MIEKEKQTKNLKYVLVTPARNEEDFIELTIKSVIAQSILPLRWVIVSDGSTDRTNDIIEKYAKEYSWLDYVFLSERKERHFAGKVRAFSAGFSKVIDLDFDVIGNLDADISFDPDYFECLLAKFAQDQNLGVAGFPFRQGTSQYNYRFSRKEHVSGACQLFRRQCYESIGGYMPLKAGAVDLTAVVTARMKGWRTETFAEKYCIHHRAMGTAESNIYRALFKSGFGDYPMGVHPVWQLFRSVYQMSRKPYILGGAMLISGYAWAMMTRVQKPVPNDFVKFRRKEQMHWLREYFKRGFGLFSRSC